MEKYNKLLSNITKLVEKGLFNSRDIKNELENLLKSKMETMVSKLNFITREEFEVQKKIIEKLQKKVNQKKIKKNYKGSEILTLSPFRGLLLKIILPPCE